MNWSDQALPGLAEHDLGVPMASDLSDARPGFRAPAERQHDSEPAIPDDLKQLRIIVSPWASGHTTVDLVVRRSRGADHWDRRTGHLDLAVTPTDLAGLSAVAILGVLHTARRR